MPYTNSIHFLRENSFVPPRKLPVPQPEPRLINLQRSDQFLSELENIEIDFVIPQTQFSINPFEVRNSQIQLAGTQYAVYSHSNSQSEAKFAIEILPPRDTSVRSLKEGRNHIESGKKEIPKQSSS